MIKSTLCCTSFLSNLLCHFLVCWFNRGAATAASNEKFVNVNGARIYIEEEGSGEPLILMHGFGRKWEHDNSTTATPTGN